ncbi:MAG: sensor histidine kinase [Bryobacteraceae bacterium]|nr:sensor histidine kinase [Bryobacteraceae bacterium]
MVIADQFLLPHLWRRYLSVMRALLGLSCVGMVLASPKLSLSGFTFLLAVLTLYSVVALFWRGLDKIVHSLVNLALDTAFFLVCAAFQEETGYWLAAFFAFYLLLSAALLHAWREVILVVIATLGYMSLSRPVLLDALRPTILLMGMFACVLTLQKKTLLERLSRLQRQVVLARGAIETAKEAERQRIAADFHDGPLQSYISFQMRLEILRKTLEKDPSKAFAELRSLQDLCATQVADLRSWVRGMRPPDVAGIGLVPALTRVVQSFERESGMTVDFGGAESPELENADAPAEIVQVLREALHNILKHSNASEVKVRLTGKNGKIGLLIEDDGRGFPFDGTYTLDQLDAKGIGPVSIRNRVRGMQGDLVLESKRGRGAWLRVEVPRNG